MEKCVFLAACVTGGDYLYSLYSYRGHIYRKYSDGSIRRADASDKRAAAWAAKCIPDRGTKKGGRSRDT